MINNIKLSDLIKRRQIVDVYLKVNSIPKTFTCPSCGFPTLSTRSGYEICIICNWEDDGQDDSNADEILGGPNDELSLTESRKRISQELEEVGVKLHLKLVEEPKKILDKINIILSNLNIYKVDREKLLSILMEKRIGINQ